MNNVRQLSFATILMGIMFNVNNAWAQDAFRSRNQTTAPAGDTTSDRNPNPGGQPPVTDDDGDKPDAPVKPTVSETRKIIIEAQKLFRDKIDPNFEIDSAYASSAASAKPADAGSVKSIVKNEDLEDVVKSLKKVSDSPIVKIVSSLLGMKLLFATEGAESAITRESLSPTEQLKNLAEAQEILNRNIEEAQNILKRNKELLVELQKREMIYNDDKAKIDGDIAAEKDSAKRENLKRKRRLLEEIYYRDLEMIQLQFDLKN